MGRHPLLPSPPADGPSEHPQFPINQCFKTSPTACSRHKGVGEEGRRKETEGLVLTLQGHLHGNGKGGGGGGGKGHSFSERPGPNRGSCPASCVRDAAAFFVLCE